MSHYFQYSGTSIKRPQSISGPLLSSKMTSLLSSGICLSFYIHHGVASAISTTKSHPDTVLLHPICIKHRVPTCSITTLDPHRSKSCLILQSVSSVELNHIWEEKKNIPFLTFISRSLTVPRQCLNNAGLKAQTFATDGATQIFMFSPLIHQKERVQFLKSSPQHIPSDSRIFNKEEKKTVKGGQEHLLQ